MAETRRTVTIVFSDVTGSTALGEQLDPEAVRRIMNRYFDESDEVLARHGGTVEKFIGDAVMAVFGIPNLHEDDALRAVRAAAELQRRVESLNEELERDWGTGIAVRIGVNTGEVVAGDGHGHTFATGDAVNVAARLEQAADPGQILVGDMTRRLVGDAVRVEGPEALSLKGKKAQVAAWRLLEVLPDVPSFTRRIDAPFVGRSAELSTLGSAFGRAVADETCQIVTILGPPGLGKSRLGRELISTLEKEARVLVGRCPSYGEGITYWPLSEIVRQVAGREPASIARIVADDASAGLIAERIAGAIGLGVAGGRSEEISWAVRKLFEALAVDRPLVVVLDDVHWAEAAFLDLIEYLAGFAQGPILLLVLARPDLLETRPSWSLPKSNASILVLEPLSVEETSALVVDLAVETGFSSPDHARIVEVSEGNPLFVEQMVAFKAESGHEADETVPPTIQALLAARIDRLPGEERAILERASVEGRSFHRAALAELLPEEARDNLGGHLMSLVRKELIRPDRATFAADDAFLFSHSLVRDAAYAAMAKELRAELHERLAGWLAAVSEEQAMEFGEVVGYHLAQAYRYRTELAPVDERTEDLGRRGSERLAAAAERAAARGDRRAQANLLGRAISLLPRDDPAQLELMAERGDALVEMGEFDAAETALAQTIEAAARTTDARIDSRARVTHSELRYSTGSVVIEEERRVAEQAIRVLEETGDDLGLARAWDHLASLHHGQGRSADAEAAWQRSVEHSRRAGNRREELAGLTYLAGLALWGPTHRDAAIELCQEILERLKGNLAEQARVLGTLGCLRALEGDFDEARRLHARRATLFDELDLKMAAAWTAHTGGWMEMLAGDPEAAEQILRPAFELLEQAGARTQLQVVGSYLAQALALLGRFEEAEPLASSIEGLDPTGLVEIASARCTRARVAAAVGQFDAAERLTGEALALVDRTDFLIDRADARLVLAEVLRLAGRTDEAAAAVGEALELHQQKGNSVAATTANALLAELSAQ